MYHLGIFDTFQRHGFTPPQASFYYPPFFSHWLVHHWILGTHPSLMWWDAACSHTQPQSLTALRTHHEDFCTRTGWWRTGITLRSEEQTLQPSTSNPKSCVLFLYLQSVPYPLAHKLLSQIRFHILVGHLKNGNLKQCDLGKNSGGAIPQMRTSLQRIPVAAGTFTV